MCFNWKTHKIGMTNICWEQICCLAFHHRAKRHCLCLCKHACILLKFCTKQSMQIQDWQTVGQTDTGYLDKHIIFVFNMLVTITSGYQSAANNMTTPTHTHTKWLHTVHTTHTHTSQLCGCFFIRCIACRILKY